VGKGQKKSWAAAAIGSMMSSTATTLIGLGTGVLVARMLGPEGRGYLGSVVTWVTLLAAFLQLPIAEAIVSNSAARPRASVIRAAFLLSITVLVVTVPPALWLLGWILQDIPSISLNTVLAYALVYLLSQMISQVYRGHFQVQRQFGTIQLYTVLQPALYLASLVALAFFMASGATVGAVIWGLVGSLVATGLIRILISGTPFLDYSEQDGNEGATPVKTEFTALARSAGYFHLTKIAQKLGTQGDRLLVVTLLIPAQAGLFFVALTFASLVPGMLATAVRLLAMPALVSAETDQKARYARKLVSISWMMGLMGFALTALLSPLLIPLLFGAPFSGSIQFATLLGAPLALRSVRVSLMEVMKSYSVTASLSLAPVLLLVVLALATAILFPIFGAFGVIAAQFMAELATIVLLSRQLRDFAPSLANGSWVVVRLADLQDIVSAFYQAIRKRLK
jgi:antigen flippase